MVGFLFYFGGGFLLVFLFQTYGAIQTSWIYLIRSFGRHDRRRLSAWDFCFVFVNVKHSVG